MRATPSPANAPDVPYDSEFTVVLKLIMLFIHMTLYVCSVTDAHLQYIAEHGVLRTGDVSYPEGITSLHYCSIMEFNLTSTHDLIASFGAIHADFQLVSGPTSSGFPPTGRMAATASTSPGTKVASTSASWNPGHWLELPEVQPSVPPKYYFGGIWESWMVVAEWLEHWWLMYTCMPAMWSQISVVTCFYTETFPCY